MTARQGLDVGVPMSNDPTRCRTAPRPPPDPRPCKCVRLRPGTRGRDVAKKARSVRGFLLRGHPVAIEHVVRDAPADLDAVVEHYERIAEEVRDLPWTSSGPFLLPAQVLVFLVPAADCPPLSLVRRLMEPGPGRSAR